MARIKTILIALGFSEYAKGIFEYGLMLAEKLDAAALVVNVINSRDIDAVAAISAMGYEVDEAHYLKKVTAEHRQMVESFIRESSFPTERVKSIFKVGNPIDELLKTIIIEDIDMVVMGTKGRTDVEHLLVGSVAEKLFRCSPVPVLSFRDPKQAEHLRKRIHLD